MQYVFILGRNEKLSIAEIAAVFPHAERVFEAHSFLTMDFPSLNCRKAISQLGGVVKIGQVIAPHASAALIAKHLSMVSKKGEPNFGISYYNGKPDRLGMEVKKLLKKQGRSCRLVTSRDKVLSSVVVTKNDCHEFMLLPNGSVAETCAVQEFEDYSHRDYGRPFRDTKSGTLPPKLAKIMINLAQVPPTSVLLDPFCGSGTILQEALLLGYKNIIGSDISEKAVSNTRKNLEWLLNVKHETHNMKHTGFKLQASSFKILNCDVRELNTKIDQIDAIVTEPYLGPPLRGAETKLDVEKIVRELTTLYLDAFKQFFRLVKPGGCVVCVFPFFRKHNLSLPILPQIKKIGFRQFDNGDLLYGRDDQYVRRQIFVFRR